MQKTHVIYLIVFLLVGCTDYLEETPDNRIELNSLEKVSELLVRAYPGGNYLFTDWGTDDSQYIETNSQLVKLTDVFLWKDLEEYDDQSTPTYYWNEAYVAIAQANAALEALEQIESDDVDFKRAIKGEALLCRAYAHFMLSSLFSNNYNEATAGTDLGIPYVLKPENVLLKEYKRNTLKEVYTYVEKDLTEGMKLLSDDYYRGSKKYHFTKNAAIAFACRFFMYKGDYAQSIAYSNQILGENTVNTNFIKDLNEYGNQPGRIARRSFYVSSTDPSNLLIVEKQVGIGLRHDYGYRTGIQYWRNMYYSPNVWGGGDLRASMGYYGDGERSVVEVAKFEEEFYTESLTATTGYPFFVQPVLRGIELLFNRIECNLALGNTTAALADLNAIGSLRYEGVDATIAQVQEFYKTTDADGNDVLPGEKEALLKLFLNEKQKEFLQEGMRWFDIKRHNLEVTHTTYDGQEIVLEKNDLRKVFQIPQSASSRGIRKNPR